MSDESGLNGHLLWELLVFFAAILSIASLVIEYTIHVSEKTEHALHSLDYAAIGLFTIDLIWKYMAYKRQETSTKKFLKKSWLDIIAIIPVFRVFRLGRFARLSRITRIRKAGKAVNMGEELTKSGEKLVKTGEKAYKGLSGTAHARHGKHAAEEVIEEE